MSDWILDLLACPLPECGGSLTPPPPAAPALLRCEDCGSVYPMVADVPILTPDPARYVASHREPILAALVEAGHAREASVAVVEAFAEGARRASPLRFEDDWVPGEETDAGPPSPIVDDGEAGRAFVRFLEATGVEGLSARLERWLGDAALGGTVCEVGPGAGALAQTLANRAERLVLVDRSFRVALRMRDRLGAGASRVASVVADAELLPFGPGRFDAVVAANVVDLLDHPQSLLDVAAHALAPGGKLVLTTPEPTLGLPEEEPRLLASMLDEAGFEDIAVEDGIPWVRAHGPRDYQVFFVWGARATRR